MNVIVISVAGIAICAVWIINILSYKTLNQAKFKVINALESKLVEQPFHDEWTHLDPNLDGERHRPFHQVERIVPWVFMCVYVAQALTILPWDKVRIPYCG